MQSASKFPDCLQYLENNFEDQEEYGRRGQVELQYWLGGGPKRL